MTANPLPSPDRRKPLAAVAGFSLVEVCLALGIVAFALVPIVGLLAVGLDSYHNADMRGRGAQAVSKIASAIRLAAPTTSTSTAYYAAAPFENGSVTPMSWTLATTASTQQYPLYFDANGDPTTLTSTTNPPQLVAMVVLTTPTTTFSPGTAQIAVAWPAIAAPTYSTSTGITFTNPQGHDESTISFVPNSP